MAKMLICPECGAYQEDTTNVRKIGVAAKIAGKWAGQQAAKFAAQAAVGMFADPSMLVNKGIGQGAVNFAKELGLDYSKDSIDSVTYKCSSCGLYWTGQDNPSSFNEKQIQTVQEHKKINVSESKANYEKRIKGALIGGIGLFLAVVLWINRTEQEVESSIIGISYTTTEYSWHTYVSMLLFVIFVPYFIVKTVNLYKAYMYYDKLVSCDDLKYAKDIMNLSAPQTNDDKHD